MWNFSRTAVPPAVSSRSSEALFMFDLSISQCPTSAFSSSNASFPPPGRAFVVTGIIPALNSSMLRIFAKPFIDRSPFKLFFRTTENVGHSLGVLIGLHHAKEISFRVLAVRKVTDAGNRRLGHHEFSPSACRRLDSCVYRFHTNRVGGGFNVRVPHQAAVDPWRSVCARGHHPVLHRPGPLVEFPPENFLIELRGALGIGRRYFKMDDSRHGSPPYLNERNSCLPIGCLLARRRRCRRAVALRRVTHNHSYDAAGQNNLEIVAVLHIRNDISEHESDGQTEQNPKRHGIHFAGKNACRYSRDQSLDRRTEDDSRQLRSHRRREPGRPAVNCSQQCPE